MADKRFMVYYPLNSFYCLKPEYTNSRKPVSFGMHNALHIKCITHIKVGNNR